MNLSPGQALSAIAQRVRRMPSSRRLNAGIALAALLAFLISAGAFTLGMVNAVEWKVVDSWIRNTGPDRGGDQVAVIGIDEYFMKHNAWPIDKNIYGEILYYLSTMGAKVIAIDVLFDNDQNTCDQGDTIFLQMMAAIPNVVLICSPMEWETDLKNTRSALPVEYAVGEGHIPDHSITRAAIPYPRLLAQHPTIAHHNLSPPHRDGLYRSLPLLQSSAGKIFPALATISASLFLDSAKISWDSVRQQVSVGSRVISTDPRSDMFVDFRQRIPFITLNDLYVSMQAYWNDSTPKIGEAELKGRIVFIGASDRLLGDNTITPLSHLFGASEEPKVMMHARAAASILGETEIHYLGRPAALLFSLILIGLLFPLYRFWNIRQAYLVLVLLLAGAYLGGWWLYHQNYLIPLAEGVTAAVLFTLFASLVVFFEKDLDRSFLFDSFKTYLSEEVIEQMYKAGSRPQLGGTEGIRTAYFTDIQGFSTFSEKIGSPTKLVELLNEYLTAMTDILMECQGTLDKYEGDAIIAFFGAPVEMPDHARKACEAAVRMQAKLGELRAKWKAEGGKWPEIVHQMRMRIGVNTGPLVTGNMGSRMRMNYTMMGDAVNLAARLESGSKQYGVYTIISQATADQLGGEFLLRELDRIRVVGKREPVVIHEVLGLAAKAPHELKRCATLFAEARRLYLAQAWDEAMRAFEECLPFEPFHPDRAPGTKTTPSHVFLERCRAFRTRPPVPAGAEWDGVYTAAEK